MPAAPRAMTVERTISDGGQRLREAYQQISNLELSLVQVRPTVHELTTQECWSGLHCPATLRTTTLPNFYTVKCTLSGTLLLPTVMMVMLVSPLDGVKSCCWCCGDFEGGVATAANALMLKTFCHFLCNMTECSHCDWLACYQGLLLTVPSHLTS